MNKREQLWRNYWEKIRRNEEERRKERARRKPGKIVGKLEVK